MKDRLFSLLATCGLVLIMFAVVPAVRTFANGCSAPKCEADSPCIVVPESNACEVGAHQTGSCSAVGGSHSCACLTPLVGGCNCIKN